MKKDKFLRLLKEANKIQRRLADLKAELGELAEASLAEQPAEPELKHGDYGYDKDGYGKLATFDVNRQQVENGLEFGCHPSDRLSTGPIEVKLGNIFTDLAARAEPLTKFKTRDVEWQMDLNTDGDLMFGVPFGQGYFVDRKKIPELILNLQRLLYTQQKAKDNE